MKKTLTMVLAFALVFALGVGGTLAWLTATDDAVVNTFTTSDITVALEETKANFQMVPGHTIDKDPKVTVGGDVDAYVFVKVEKSANYGTYLADCHNDIIAAGWTELQTGVYYREVAKDATVKEFSVINGDKVTVLGTVTKADMEAAKTNAPTLTFTAYASQMYKKNAEKFTAAEAWANVANPTQAY